MNKRDFLKEVKKQLSPLDENEQNELLNDYETHFQFGLQNGKTEEEVSHELGNPSELAKVALGDQYPLTVTSSNAPFSPFFTLFFLFFINITVMIPIFLSLWVTWLSLGLAAFMIVLSPFIVLFEFLYFQQFNASKLFTAILFTGVGMFLGCGVYYIKIYLLRISKTYASWNINIWRGR